LVIDPWILAYSTYLGGGKHEYMSSLGVDAEGAVYVGGFTHSADFPSSRPDAREAAQVSDVFVTKISPKGDALEYTAFFPIGCSPCGTAYAMCVDAGGSAFVCGITTTSRFPIKNAFQPAFGGGFSDGFILKLARSGRSLVYSSFIGGNGFEEIRAVAVDADGAAYVLGVTMSRDFPVKQPFQKAFKGGQDAFVAKVSPDGRSLAYATFLGGSAYDYAGGIAVDAAGEAHVAGYTYSKNFPVKKPVQSRLGGSDDIFVTKLSQDGRSLRYSTYLGGTRSDRNGVLALVSDGSAVVIGATSGNFPVKNAFQKTRKGSSDGVVAKLSPTGSLAFSTFLGGKGLDTLWGVAAGKDGTIYLAGCSESPDFPRKNPYQPKLNGKSDAVLTALSGDGQSLVFSTFWGGRYHDYGRAVAVGPDGAVFIGGETNSDDFPVKGGFQGSFKGGFNDMFVSAFRLGPTARPGGWE
ncbi:MAG: SBBP repeat-containing protein, partial [Candidatus Aminicenantes bacterium]|nr:SBBP repeat-containing protein [Candidatus Aminicenantes bacterium]